MLRSYTSTQALDAFQCFGKGLSIEENQDEGSMSYSSPYCQDGLLSGDSIVF